MVRSLTCILLIEVLGQSIGSDGLTVRILVIRSILIVILGSSRRPRNIGRLGVRSIGVSFQGNTSGFKVMSGPYRVVKSIIMSSRSRKL